MSITYIMQESLCFEWINRQHVETNHKYDHYLPYEFHLRMVLKAGVEFESVMNKIPGVTSREHIYLALFGHDLIEDTRTTFNDVREQLGSEAAEIIYAVTNEKGRNRSERANAKYYEGIRNCPGAIFVKLCDRIANVRYSKMTEGSMFEKYKKELDHFIKELQPDGYGIYAPMVALLTRIFYGDGPGY